MLITIANFLFKCNIKHVPIRVVQGNFNLGWPKIISCHITTTVTTALLLLHKMLECFIFFLSSPFQIYHAFLEKNRIWKSLGNSILFGIRRWVLNFFRNKALIVSQLKRFLAWFNSATWKYGALYEQGRQGEKIASAKGQYFKLYRRLFYLFMRCFMAIVLFWRVYFISIFSFVHFIRPSVVRNFLLLTQNIKPKENDSIVHKINILPQTLISNDLSL